MNARTFHDARVLETTDVATDIRRVVLEPPPAARRRADPGTHLDVRVEVPGGRPEVRSYSVVDSTPDGSRLALTVHRSPTSRGGSAYVHGLRPGDSLRCTGPLQNFPLRIGAQRYLLLAGGVGITALAATARTLARLGADVELVYVGRSRDRMPYLTDLQAELGDRVRPVVSSEGTRLDVEDLIARTARDAPGTEAYVCGPLGLLDAVTGAWHRHGLPQTNLRYETFGSSGRHAAGRFRVQVPALDLETVVDPGSTVLEALRRRGADLMYDCLKGECGLCVLPVRTVEGVLDHRDVFLSPQQQESAEALCVCVSRVAAGPEGNDPLLVLDLP
ncbi:2Fe-2S iron-sulfur cluster-binding protein [Kineococcus sp. LSe6-4]|uniref:2Fe-2S iron-sulfur cluster-binding protein n=1 Tax=Kineococcus halophytocola TaxID=3234027 RepID=A0ABV4H353_9ACTN